jgi:predicted nuclease with TOPRIM domain
MTENIDNLVLEQLRAIRADLRGLKDDMRDVKARLSSIETYNAALHGDQARSSVKFDDLAERVERLEARAGLVENPA